MGYEKLTHKYLNDTCDFKIDDQQKPNSSLVLTEPGKLPLKVKEELLKFFFEDMKIAR